MRLSNVGLGALAMLTLLGCKKPMEAPEELQELAVWFWVEWEDPDALSEGVDNLLAFVEDEDELDVDGKWDQRSYVIDRSMSESDTDGLTKHGHDPADAVGVSLFYHSDYKPKHHLQHIRMKDQTPVEPSSPQFYERTFFENDGGCLRDNSCELARSDNEVERDNFLYHLTYDMRKEWRWVESDAGRALIGRSFNYDESYDDGSVRVLQGYSIDLFLPYRSNGLRYQVAWSQTDSPLKDEDITKGIAKGIDDGMETADEWLSEN